MIHELAHAVVWKKFGNAVNPHGKEWKDQFRRMMLPFLNPTFFNEEILKHLSRHLINPLSSTIRDIDLSESLRKYDNSKKMTISQIKDGDRFRSANGKEFKRICKLRKNYKCLEISTKKLYRFSPLSEVILL